MALRFKRICMGHGSMNSLYASIRGVVQPVMEFGFLAVGKAIMG